MLCGYLEFQKNLKNHNQLLFIGFDYFKNLKNSQFPQKINDFLADYFILKYFSKNHGYILKTSFLIF